MPIQAIALQVPVTFCLPVVDRQRTTAVTKSVFKAYVVFFSYFRSSPDRQTDGQTENGAYEPTVQRAQVGSKGSETLFGCT